MSSAALPTPPSRRRLLSLAVIGALVAVGAAAAWVAGHKHWPREKDFTNGIGMELVWCEPGTFLMGSPESEAGRQPNETQHEVTLTHGFWIGRYEVTQAEWSRIMGGNPSEFNSWKVLWLFDLPRPRAPVEQVSWQDAVEFCRKLTERERAAGQLGEGWEYALPTEAQWEYACRAGTSTAYAYGDQINQSQARYDAEDGTALCGRYLPNGWGIYDLHGNVWEWCADWYQENRSSEAATDPQGPENGEDRVIRGGSWGFTAQFCRSAYRVRYVPGYRGHIVGFRPVRRKKA